MSPKSLLRHPQAVSSLKDFEEGCFQELIDDTNDDFKKSAKRLVLCSGKIYYELIAAREKLKKDIPIIRVEQFYPFPESRWQDLLKSYKKVAEVVWCQEGPQNNEGWNFMQRWLPSLLNKNQTLIYAGRSAQASPADSFVHVHQKEQQRIVMSALGEETSKS